MTQSTSNDDTATSAASLKTSISQLHTVCRYYRGIAFFAAVAIWLGIEGQAFAQTPYDNTGTPEGWAWAQIKQGKAANFNTRCQTSPALDPRAKDEGRWTDACRRLPAAFVTDVLTQAPWREQIPIAGVTIIGARIEGDIRLENAKLNRALVVEQCRVENAINIDAASTDDVIELVGSRITGAFSASGFHSKLSLRLSDSEFKQLFRIDEAKIDGRFDMQGATLDNNLSANGLQVGSSLWMRSDDRNKATFKEVNLTRAKVTGNLDMVGATIDGALIADSLTVGGYLLMRSDDEKNRATFKGVNLRGAKITGGIDMVGATIDGALTADSMTVGRYLVMRSDDHNKSTFKEVDLTGTKVTGNLDMSGATLDGALTADALTVESSLFMRSDDQNKATFKEVNLRAAKVTGNLDMVGATLDGALTADSLTVGRHLFMRSNDHNKSTFKEVDLNGTNVTGSLDMSGATLDGALTADALTVGGSLFMRSDDQNKATFKEVNLRDAKVTANLDMIGATIDGALMADALQVGVSLFLRSSDKNKATFKDVNLVGAIVGSNVDMGGATFDGFLNANALKVGATLFMNSFGKNKPAFKDVNLVGAKVTSSLIMIGGTLDGTLQADSLQVGDTLFANDVIGKKLMSMTFVHTSNLDLRGATLAELNLASASVAGDLRLGGGGKSTVWRTGDDKPGKLSLRNAHIGNLMDAREAWPDNGHLQIDGFSFAHLGGYAGDTGPEMRSRGMKWWDDWARRDQKYSPAPYEQLATALVASGDRAAADEIRFLGRVRQREAESGWLPWMFALFLEYVAGFGIGDYTFRVLYWVIGISVAGGVYLWARVPRARENGPIWCLGASLSRLLPVIEINKEFSDFFSDPKRRRLTGRQSFVFSVIGMVGWVLGAILVAAVAGLTQRP